MPEPPKPDASKVLTADDRVGLDKFEFDEEPFITVDTQVCRTCEGKPCLYVCPTKVYRLEKGELGYNTEGCVELGACAVVCKHMGKGAIRWSYPRGAVSVWGELPRGPLRAAIVEAGRREPGIGVRELARRVDHRASSVGYSVKALRRDGVLRTDRVSRRLRCFPADDGPAS